MIDKMTTLAMAFATLVVAAYYDYVPRPPAADVHWTRISPASPGWPETVVIMRGSAVWQNKLAVSLGGSVHEDAQTWLYDGTSLTKHYHLNNLRINVLFAHPSDGSIYMGVGSQHVPGSAFVARYDADNVYDQIGINFSGQDMVYSMAWFDGALHVGTMSEDVPGAARVYRWNGHGYDVVFGPGINAAPRAYDYSGAYEMLVHGGSLHVGFTSRTAGHGDVWRLDPGGWVNLGGVGSDYALAGIVYRGEMVWSFSGLGAGVRVHRGGAWVRLGNMPSEWATATLWNHMAVFKGQLYVGVGGAPGKASVWRLNAERHVWEKVAGGGINGSWRDPVGSDQEWVYRLQEWDGHLYACLAGNHASVSLWRMVATSAH